MRRGRTAEPASCKDGAASAGDFNEIEGGHSATLPMFAPNRTASGGLSGDFELTAIETASSGDKAPQGAADSVAQKTEERWVEMDGEDEAEALPRGEGSTRFDEDDENMKGSERSAELGCDVAFCLEKKRALVCSKKGCRCQREVGRHRSRWSKGVSGATKEVDESKVDRQNHVGFKAV